MKIKTLLMVSSIAFLAACQTTPDATEPTETVAETTTTPVVPAPSPVVEAPVTVENPNTLPPVQGPAPGTIAEFMYVAGGEGRVFFAYDQYDLSAEAQYALSRQAEWLQNYSNVVAVIEGNADERGTREYNLALAARRAESVKSYLVSQGVSPSRLTTVSYGKERPIDGRSSEEGWARNRNAHTNLMSGTIG